MPKTYNPEDNPSTSCTRESRELVKQNRNLKDRRRVDWDRVKADYVHGVAYFENGLRRMEYPTAESLGEKYDVSPSTVSGYIFRGKWVLEREQYKEKIKLMHDREMSQYKLRASSLYDVQNITRVERFGRLIDANLAQYAEYFHDENIGMDTFDEQLAMQELPPPSFKQLREGIDALDKLHNLTRKILGEPVNYDTVYDEVKQAVDKEKNTVKVSEVHDLMKSIRKELDMKTVDIIPNE